MNGYFKGAILLLVCILWTGLPPGDASARAPDPDRVVAVSENRQFLVALRPGVSGRAASQMVADAGASVVGQIPALDVWLVEVDAAAELQPEGSYSLALPQAQVRWVEANGRLRAAETVTPDDNFYAALQENLRRIRLPEAWAVTTGNRVPIAVVDSGIDLDHPDLVDKLWSNPREIEGNGWDDDGNGYTDDINGWDFVEGDPTPDDDFAHGSHVAGIVAAHSNNGIGVAGVAWDNPIMVLKVLRSDGTGTWFDTTAAIVYAADKGARVINLSLGDETTSESVTAAILYARSRGCLAVAAAGNGGSDVLFPANVPQVVAVTASDSTGTYDVPWPSSNRGPEVDVTAPGVAIYSTSHQGGYYFGNGTSMATPHVSGVAALLWAKAPGLAPDEVAQLIRTTSRDVWSPGWDALTGWGIVDAARAVGTLQRYYYYFPTLPGKR